MPEPRRRRLGCWLPAEARERWLDPAWNDLVAGELLAGRRPGGPRFRLRVAVLLVQTVALALVSTFTPASPPRHAVRREESVMGRLGTDLRYALRSLASAPAFAAAVVLALALGSGANGAVFAFVEGMLLRPLPFAEPERLVLLTSTHVEREVVRGGLSPGDFLALRGAASLESTGLWVPWWLTLRGDGDPESLPGLAATPELFSTLGVAALHGRVLVEADAAPDAEKVVVLANGFWRRRFGGDPAVVGRSLELDGEPWRVVGVLAEGFRFPTTEVALFHPTRIDPARATHDRRWMHVVARLAPGATVAGAQAELGAIAARLAAERPESNAGWGVAVEPLHEVVVASARPALVVLQGLVAVVLLVAAVDVANLSIARARARRRELAVRSALGAGRRRLAVQLLLEAGVLGTTGAIAGSGLAALVVELLKRLAPARIGAGDHEQVAGHAFARLDEVGLDGSVIATTWVAAVAVALVAGLAAVWAALGGDLKGALHGARGAGADGRDRVRRLLVAAELTLASTLLVAAGLLVRSLDAMERVDPGFRPREVVTMQVSLGKYHRAPERAAAMGRVLEAVAAERGVEAAGFSTTLPFAGVDWREELTVVGAEATSPPTALYHAASPGFFRALGVALLEGRDFSPADLREAPGALVVNRTFAERHLAGAALGKRLRFDDEDRDYEVVGVVADTHHAGLDLAAEPAVYAVYTQRTPWFFNLAVRGDGPAAGLVRPVQAAIHAVEPGIPFREVRLLEERMADAASPRRFRTIVVAAFSLLALILAGLGVYGIVTFFVASRRRELGVRLAIGANGADVARLVVGQGLALAAGGLAGGLAGGALVGRWLEHLLYGVGPLDGVTFAAVPLVLGALAVVASWLPARRAARLDPVDVLRAE